MRFSSLLPCVFCLLLTGCSLTPTLPNSPAAAAAIRGIVHGGQQPVVGAHVYLFAANTTAYAGPGIAPSTSNASVSLLNSTSNTTKDTSGGVTNGDYYATTDVNGSFSLSNDYTCTSGQAVYIYVLGGNPGAGVNASAAFMAILGTCPDTDTLAATAPTVWINEITTVAAAYAMAGFASDALHVGYSGSALGKTGITNAFANAAQLASLSTGVAVASTTGITTPQAEIITLANTLAACINSDGTITGPTSATNCYTLFYNAQSAGTSGTVPTDTATAAINIAHNPAAAVSALYDLQPGTGAPFSGGLTSAPNDFTVALEFTGSSLSTPRGIAIDAAGDAWVGNASSVTMLSPLGVGVNYDPAGSHLDAVYGIAIDNSGNVWAVDGGGFYSPTKLTSSGALASGSYNPYDSGGQNPWGIAIDASGNAWQPITSIVNAEMFGSALSSAPTLYNPAGSGLSEAYDVAIDASGRVWLPNTNKDTVSVLTTAGANVTNAPFAPANSGLSGPQGIAIDASGRAWITNTLGATVTVLNADGTLAGHYSGGGLNGANSIAIDGAGNVWFAGSAMSWLTEFNSAGTAISPSTGYKAANLYATGAISEALAIDGSGDVWVTSKTNNAVFEFLGAAAPVVTPLAANLVSPYGTSTVNLP